ncbi:hypothetical protein SPRG_17949, partial [Saprolegnia parasitica CBS 223.65]
MASSQPIAWAIFPSRTKAMMFLRRGSAPMASLLGRRWCHASKLPNHIKFRLMDIEFTQVMEGSKLVKW